MSVTRANVEAAKQLVIPRLGDAYVYGGMFDSDVHDGTDCSGVWNDVLGMVVGRFQWGREAEGATTEDYRYIPVGGVGPFGTIRVASPADIPADAVVKLALHHGPGGGENSHMWGELDGMRIESAGSKGLVTAPAAWEITNPYSNAWAYLPGPIVEDGTTPVVVEPPDTLYADVSEWQTAVDDSYPWRVIAIRSNDGTHRDAKWAQNYGWCRAAADSGKLAFFIVYYVYRPGVDSVAVLQDMVGQPHPRMAVMIDVESWGGEISGNQSAGINAEHDRIAAWLGDGRRVIGYGNVSDLNNLWPQKPGGVRLVVAGYGANPDYPGKIAHQYTDGEGYGDGLPEGAAPFGNCDMNAADGLTATALAAALGIETTNSTTTGEDDPLMALTPDEAEELLAKTRQVWGALFNPIGSLSKYKTDGEGDIYTTKDLPRYIDKNVHELLIEKDALLGIPGALALVKREADKGDTWAQAVYDKAIKGGADVPAEPPAAPAAAALTPTPTQGNLCALGATCKLDNSATACAIGGGKCALVAQSEAAAK